MNAARAEIASAAVCIDVRGVSYRYRHAPADALQNIDLQIAGGAIFGLLGPNGAGKSTLLGLLSGSLRVQRGSIAIDGATLPRDAHSIKQRSAIVPQEYAFYEDLSGRENLAFFAGIAELAHKEYERNIAQSAEICRLTDVLEQRAGDYSGGLKRRLNLAIGLLTSPHILYLDEPTVGIDAESRQCIVDAIRALREQGVTIVYTSHYMEEVEQLCEAIAVIDRGRVVLQGPMDALLQREGARTLSVHLSRPAPQLLERFAQFRPEHAEFRDWQLELAPERLQDVFAAIASSGAQVERLQFGVSRLEKMYLQVLARAEMRGESAS